MNIAILDMYNGRANEGMRCIKMLCGQFLAQEHIEGHNDIFDVRQKDELPNIENYDLFISTGGPGNPLPEGHAWEAKFNDFIDQIDDLIHDLFHNRIPQSLWFDMLH